MGIFRGDSARVFAVAGVAALVAALAPARPWGNYYLYGVPWLCLLFSTMFCALLANNRARQIFLMAVCAVLAFGFYQTVRVWKTGVVDKRWRDLQLAEVCAYIDHVSAPDEPLFVWGFLGEYYVECKRRPTARYVIPAPVAGWVPWFPDLSLEQEERFAAPGSREILVRDLEEAKPGVILDAPYASMAGRSMTRYALLRNYVRTNYTTGARFGHMTAYVRRKSR